MLRTQDTSVRTTVNRALQEKLLRLEKIGKDAGLPIGQGLTGWRKIVVGDRDWRILFTGDAEETVATVWVIGDRDDAACHRVADRRTRARGKRKPEVAGRVATVSESDGRGEPPISGGAERDRRWQWRGRPNAKRPAPTSRRHGLGRPDGGRDIGAKAGTFPSIGRKTVLGGREGGGGHVAAFWACRHRVELPRRRSAGRGG